MLSRVRLWQLCGSLRPVQALIQSQGEKVKIVCFVWQLKLQISCNALNLFSYGSFGEGHILKCLFFLGTQ